MPLAVGFEPAERMTVRDESASMCLEHEEMDVRALPIGEQGGPVRFLGIDSHKHYLVVAVLEQGKVVERFRVELPHELDSFRLKLRPKDQLVVEATSNCFRLHDELAPHVDRFVVANPAQTRGAAAHAAKTDNRCAETLARLLAAGFTREVWVPPPHVRSLRHLVEQRRHLSVLRGSASQRVRAVMQQELLEPFKGSVFNDKNLGFLAGALARDPHMRKCFDSQVLTHDSLDREIVALDKHLAEWCKHSEEAQLLLTAPGIGPVVACTLIAQIGDIARFASPGHLCSYAGLVPRVELSGMSSRRGPITRAGRSTLRWAVSIAAMNAIRVPGPLRDFKLRLQERRPKGVAMTAAARKFLVIVWRILTYCEPYRDAPADRTRRKLHRCLSWGRRGKRRDRPKL